MKLRFDKLFFALIILIAIFFRFYNLSQVPPQASVDEVSIGWNAYSILKTGADEYDTKFPILLRAYDDFRPALYVYLVVPFVVLFDLGTLAIRLPSALLGVLGVLGTYFLVKELFRGSKLKFEIGNLKLGIPEVTALLLSISPWHIYISRLGHEVNASFTFLIFGLLFFFRFLDKGKWNLVLSALFLGLSFDSYQSAKIIIPLLVTALSILFYKKLIKEKSIALFSALAGLIIIAPILISSFSENALIRFKATNLLENSELYYEKVFDRHVLNRQNNDLLGLIYDNRKIATSLLLTQSYLSHFDPVWLFLNKGEEPFKAPTFGLLYLFELPLIFISLLFLLKSNIESKKIVFLIIFGLITILPASLTTGFPHAMRAYSFLPVPQIFAAVGFVSIAAFIKNKSGKYLFAIASITILMFSVSWYSHAYFSLLPRELGHHFQYGVVDALKYSDTIDEKYSLVVVSNKERLFESYMFYLYTKKYNPHDYQKSGGTVSGGFAQEHKIGNYMFGDIDSNIIENSLYIINPSEVTSSMDILKEIKDLEGKTVLLITETK